jgi:hypothetical protein
MVNQKSLWSAAACPRFSFDRKATSLIKRAVSVLTSRTVPLSILCGFC